MKEAQGEERVSGAGRGGGTEAQVGGICFANEEGRMSHLNTCKEETIAEMYAYFWKKAGTELVGYIQ